MGERKLILFLLNYMEISVISMSHIHTGSLMILKCAPLLDKRGKKGSDCCCCYYDCFNGWPGAYLLMTTQIFSTFVKI